MSKLMVAAALCRGGAAPALAQGPAVTIDRATCDQLVEQVPDPDVNYRPGVDVNGQPVAPADLPGSQPITMPTEFSIPIEINLAKRLQGLSGGASGGGGSTGGGTGGGAGSTSGVTGLFMPAQIGVVTYKDGQFFFNGQPLQDPEIAQLAALCARAVHGK